MKTNTFITGRLIRGVLAAGASIAIGTLPGACSAPTAARDQTVNPSLRAITPPPGASVEDADRAMLARFVGVWDFTGRIGDQIAENDQTRGLAAAVVEDGHFVLLDMMTARGQLGGKVSRKSGTMLLAVEPGIGLTLTAWGDASPAITRATGHVEAAGSRFLLRESRTPQGRGKVSMTIEFQTDDRWTAEVRDESSSGRPVIAKYTFTRVSL